MRARKKYRDRGYSKAVADLSTDFFYDDERHFTRVRYINNLIVKNKKAEVLNKICV